MEETKQLTVLDDKKLLLNTVAKGATEAEFKMFLEFCKSTGLNPYKKEIWFIKTGNQLQMMTGINGYIAIANRHPEYDGMTVDIQEEDGKLVSATASVYRKDRKFPSVAKVYFSEYAKNSPIWKNMPRMMLQKVAKSVALREAFPQELGGTYTEEEMPDNFSLKCVENKKLYIYDLALYEDEEKIEGLLDYFQKKGCFVDGTIIKTNEPYDKLKNCEIEYQEEI